MFIFYDFIFLMFAIAYLPTFLLKRKKHPGFGMRLGSLPKFSDLDRPIWVHAVSVGEAIAVKHLVEALRHDYPEKRFVISTVTETGNRIARDFAKKTDLVIYLPLDFSFIVRKVIDRIDPALFIIAETEIWPNMISYLHKKKVKTIVINGRISDRSFFWYRMVRSLLKGILRKVDMFCVQTSQDRQRLLALGVPSDNIKITGNMKFDIEIRDYTELRKDYTDYRMRLGLGAKDLLLIAASTHSGEEEIVLDVFDRLRKDIAGLRLLIAPRHPDRVGQIEKAVTRYSLKPVRISTLPKGHKELVNPEFSAGQNNVFLLDTIGQLMYFYAISDVVFVGGSLIRKGGHNILEPASLGKPVLFGNYMFNFRDIANLFTQDHAAIMVNTAEGLRSQLEQLLSDDVKRSHLGKLAKELVVKNQGATQRNKDIIRLFIENQKSDRI